MKNTVNSIQIKGHDLKRIIVPIIVTAVIVATFVVSFFYYYNNTVINKGTLIKENLTDLVYQIDNVKIDEGFLEINGWCFKRGEDTSNPKLLPTLRIILAEADNYENLHYFSANYGLPESEVGEYFNNGVDYTNCGFNVKIDTLKLDLENKNYEIIIQQNIRKTPAVQTGVFIDNGKMVFADPELLFPLEIENTDLEEIVNNGYLRAFRPDVGMYIYQYGWELYWIADDYYPFDKGWNFMGYFMATTQPDMLPANRIELGVDFDNLCWQFSDEEITHTINCGKYRVAKMQIPVGYSVAVISTGYYTEGDWVWRERFFPRYIFK